MTILGQSTDYTDLDFDALRARLFNLITSVFPTWTDQQVTNFGNILVELFAHTGDVLTFLLDNHARESRISTASQRRSLIALSKLIRYTPRGATAAIVEQTFSIPTIMAADVPIAAGTRVKTLSIASPVSFQVLEDAVIPAGALSVTVDVEHSESREDLFQATGLANQEVQLSATPYLDDSLSIAAGNGTFTQVESFLESTALDRHFTVAIDQNNRATVRFGNGVNGTIPTGTIAGGYKTGGGAAGNVEPSSLTKLEASFTDELGNTAQVSTINAAGPSTRGEDRESSEQIRTNAPEGLRALTRSVAREDYEIHARKLAGVARAFMTTSNEDAGVSENAGILYIVPTGGGSASQTLRDAVLEQVTTTFPKTLTFQVAVATANYLAIDIIARIHFRKGTTPAAGKAAIIAALTSFFAVSLEDGTPNPNVDFGYYYQDSAGTPTNELPFSDVFNVIRDLTAVRKIDDTEGLLLNAEATDVAIAPREFPTLGTVTVINAETGTEV